MDAPLEQIGPGHLCGGSQFKWDTVLEGQQTALCKSELGSSLHLPVYGSWDLHVEHDPNRLSAKLLAQSTYLADMICGGGGGTSTSLVWDKQRSTAMEVLLLNHSIMTDD